MTLLRVDGRPEAGASVSEAARKAAARAHGRPSVSQGGLAGTLKPNDPERETSMTRTLVAALTMAAFVSLQPLGVDADPVLSGPFVTVGVGDTFTIPISITGATEVTSWQFDLAYNPSIVKANDVTEGPFMSAFGFTLFTAGVINNVTGLISLVADAYVDLPPDPSGSGVLANVEFTALAPGVSPLTFANVFVNDLDSGFQTANGQVTVTGKAVPEPMTLTLLGLGLGTALRVRARRARARRS